MHTQTAIYSAQALKALQAILAEHGQEAWSDPVTNTLKVRPIITKAAFFDQDVRQLDS